LYKILIKTHLNQFGFSASVVYHFIKQSVHIFICETKLPFVCLIRPQIRRWLFFHNFFRYSQIFRKLPYLCFVQITNGVDGACQIAVPRTVAQKKFGFIACSQNNTAMLCGTVKYSDHTHAGKNVSYSKLTHVRFTLYKRLSKGSDICNFEVYSQSFRHKFGIRHAFFAGKFIGESHRKNPVFSQSLNSDSSRKSGIYSAGKTKNNCFKPYFFRLFLYECG